jgi:hypothetical protein
MPKRRACTLFPSIQRHIWHWDGAGGNGREVRLWIRSH